jgi:hypothetical protein
MNKLDQQHPSLTYPSDLAALQLPKEIISVNAALEPAGRLIILMPANADYAMATKRIWKLAMTTGMPVQFIGLCKDWSQEPRIRRDLVTMSALIRDGRVGAEAKIEIGTDWVKVVKHNVQPGDMIVCFAEQRTGLFQRPLSQILESNMKARVYILSGLCSQAVSEPNWLSQILGWIGSIGIIGGAFLVQIRIVSLPENWAQAALLILSVLGEISLIWGWNSLFS